MLNMMKKHLDDLAAGNWDAYRASLADDAVYEEISTHQRVQGANEYVAAIQRWKTAFPDLRATVIDSVMSEDKGVIEVEWEGTHSGVLAGPFGTIPATNKQGKIRAVLVLKFANGKLAENRHYFDMFSLLSQLGLVPGRPAQAPEAATTQAPAHS